MDGLDRLVEMLEKRFGKFWADLLLVIVVAGAVGWALNAFVVDLVIPVAHFVGGVVDYFRGQPLILSKADVRALIVQLLVSALMAVVAYVLFRVLIVWANTRGAALRKELESLLQKAKQETALMHEEYTRLDQIRLELEATLQEQLANSRELESLVGGVETHINAKYDRLDEKGKILLKELQTVLEEGIAARSSPTTTDSEDE